jgi:hypothetical protein
VLPITAVLVVEELHRGLIRVDEQIPLDAGLGVKMHLQHAIGGRVAGRHDFAHHQHVRSRHHAAARIHVPRDHKIRNRYPAGVKPQVDRLPDSEARSPGDWLERRRQGVRNVLMPEGGRRGYLEAPIEQLDPFRRLAERQIFLLRPGQRVVTECGRHGHLRMESLFHSLP